MVIRPKADETFEIVYTVQKTESWDMYAQALDRFLTRKSGSVIHLTVEHPALRRELFYLTENHSFTLTEWEISLRQGFS